MTSETPYIHSRDGVVFKPESGKLYIFSKYSVNVLKAWPRPMAWKKTTKHNQKWIRFRPSLSSLNYELKYAPLKTEEEYHLQLSKYDSDEREKLASLDPENREALALLDPEDREFLASLSPEEREAIASSWKERFDWSKKRFVWSQKNSQAWIQWYETIPADVRAVIAPFRKQKWHLLSMIASCGKPAMDLIKSNPALAFALASNWVFHKPAVTQPMRSIRALLQSGKKQTDILKWLGFPATESVRKILMKLPAEEISISTLFTLREAVNTPHLYKLLSRLPRLNNCLLYLFFPQTRFLLTLNLLQEFSDLHEKCEGNTFRSALRDNLDLLKDTATMHSQLFPETYNHSPIQSLAQLSRYHDLLCKRIDIERFKCLSFPPPPLQGTNEIIPLKTPEDLYEEGKIQHNCVASYSEQVALMRNIYIYRMLKPERCTLEITQSSSRWTLAQLKAGCNRNPSEKARLAAEKWLNDSQNLL